MFPAIFHKQKNSVMHLLAWVRTGQLELEEEKRREERREEKRREKRRINISYYFGCVSS